MASSSESDASGEETWSDYDGSQAAEEEQVRRGVAARRRDLSRLFPPLDPTG